MTEKTWGKWCFQRQPPSASIVKPDPLPHTYTPWIWASPVSALSHTVHQSWYSRTHTSEQQDSGSFCFVVWKTTTTRQDRLSVTLWRRSDQLCKEATREKRPSQSREPSPSKPRYQMGVRKKDPLGHSSLCRPLMIRCLHWVLPKRQNPEQTNDCSFFFIIFLFFFLKKKKKAFTV